LLSFSESITEHSNAGVIARVATNFTNIQNVLLQCLSSDSPYLAEIISSSCELSGYSLITGRGHLLLVDRIPDFMPQPIDHKAEAYFIIQQLAGWRHHTVSNAKQLIDQALEDFKHFYDPDMQCKLIQSFHLFIWVEIALGLFYTVAATYHNTVRQDYGAAIQCCQSALALAMSIGSGGAIPGIAPIGRDQDRLW
jgi:hypothetical protein